MPVLSCHCLATSSNITCISVAIGCSHTSDFLPTNANGKWIFSAHTNILSAIFAQLRGARRHGGPGRSWRRSTLGCSGQKRSPSHLLSVLELAMNFREDFKTTDRAFSQLKLLKAPSYFTLKNYVKQALPTVRWNWAFSVIVKFREISFTALIWYVLYYISIPRWPSWPPTTAWSWPTRAPPSPSPAG